MYVCICMYILSLLYHISNVFMWIINVWGKDVERDSFVPSDARVAAGMFTEKTQEPTHEVMALFQRACKQFFLHGWVPLLTIVDCRGVFKNIITVIFLSNFY